MMGKYYSVVGRKFDDKSDALEFARARGFETIAQHNDDNEEQAVVIRLSDQAPSEHKALRGLTQQTKTRKDTK